MAIISGYFNSLNGDRKYNAETMSKYFAGLISKGVLQNYDGKFMVTANEGMTVQISTGKAYFSDGKWIENNAPINITLDPSDVVLNRIDRIVLRRDLAEESRACTVVLVKGTPASTPVAPELNATPYVEELSLCTIYVGKLVESITQANITDTRLDSSVCGFVTGLIDQVDTADLYAQYEASFDEYYEKSTAEMDEFTKMSQEDFNAWFSTLKTELSTSTLLREFTSQYVTVQEDETLIPINIPQYIAGLDILDVYINGLRLVPNVEFTATSTLVTLAKPLSAGQPVEMVVFKSVDGEKAIKVIEQVENLQQNKADRVSTTATLSASGWTASGDVYVQTVAHEGILATSVLLVSPHPDSYLVYGNTYASAQAIGSITFTTTELPAVDLKVNVLNLGG